jgi:hypothetical protein
VSDGETTDCGQGFDEDCGHFLAREIPSRQHKGRHTRRQQGCQLSAAVANPPILREHDPSSSANFPEPVSVSFIRGKVVVVNLDVGFRLRRATATLCFPRDRSRKKTRSSSGFELELAADGFFDFEPRTVIILR